MILKNKLTKETLDIPYSEFRIKFVKEIQDAFESFMLRITYSPLEVGQIIYEHGNSDPNIGHGDVIRYTPKEIEDILMEKHRDDD